MSTRQSMGGISESLLIREKSMVGIKKRNVKPESALTTDCSKSFALMSAHPTITNKKSGKQS